MVAPVPGHHGREEGAAAPRAVEREARAQLRMAVEEALGRSSPEVERLLEGASPAAVAQLIMRAMGRTRRGVAGDPVSALYQVALDYRGQADGAHTLADPPAPPADRRPGR